MTPRSDADLLAAMESPDAAVVLDAVVEVVGRGLCAVSPEIGEAVYAVSCRRDLPRMVRAEAEELFAVPMMCP